MIKSIANPIKRPSFIVSLPNLNAVKNDETKLPIKRQAKAVIAEIEFGFCVLIKTKGDNNIRNEEIKTPIPPPMSE